MQAWVSRDKEDSWINIWNSKIAPQLDEDSKTVYCFPKVYKSMQTLGVECFKDIFGFTPRKGSCKEYKLSLKEVK